MARRSNGQLLETKRAILTGNRQNQEWSRDEYGILFRIFARYCGCPYEEDRHSDYRQRPQYQAAEKEAARVLGRGDGAVDEIMRFAFWEQRILTKNHMKLVFDANCYAREFGFFGTERFPRAIDQCPDPKIVEECCGITPEKITKSTKPFVGGRKTRRKKRGSPAKKGGPIARVGKFSRPFFYIRRDSNNKIIKKCKVGRGRPPSGVEKIDSEGRTIAKY